MGNILDKYGCASDEVIREHADLISRGVRSIAIIGQFKANPDAMLLVATKVETLAPAEAIPFVIDKQDGLAIYGYARKSWAIDLLQWASSENIPQKQRDRILGLLLGYSVESIAEYCEKNSGRCFQSPLISA